MTRGLVLAVTLVAVGCGGDDNGGTAVDASVDAAAPGGDLVGNWAFNVCSSTKLRRTMTATSTTFLYITSWYDDADSTCSTPTVQLTVNESYTVGSAATLDPTAHEIDVQTKGTTLTIASGARVATANSSAWCGYSDWQVNVAKDVTGVFCDPDTYWSVGHILYELYKVEGGKLYFGDASTGTGTSDGTRPTQIHTSTWYTRQ